MATVAIIRAALAGRRRAVVLCRGAPDASLCAQIAAEYPQCFIDWLWLAERCHLTADAPHPAVTLRNPRGVSLYPFSERQHWWLFPPGGEHLLTRYFAPADICVPDGVLPVAEPVADSIKPKPWLTLPAPRAVTRVCVVGGGIAAAASAYALAKRGIAVTVLEQRRVASAASGNRQGLLYAKISAHDTMQSRLLLQAYAFAAGMVRAVLPEGEYWSACGVLHLDDNTAETCRNRELGAQACSLFRYLDAAQASAQAGVDLSCGGLWWPHGGWLHPPALVRALLCHPLIEVHEHARVGAMRHDGAQWRLHTDDGRTFTGSHTVLCCGADGQLGAPLGIRLSHIRGQTDNSVASGYSARLRVALSGNSYLSPAWQGAHCFGATFHPNDGDDAVRAADSRANRDMLARLHPRLAASLPPAALPAHAALRCDAYDHLPVVGALGDAAAMRGVYAKLAYDKNYPFDVPCPYMPQLYLNTAHGSRGLLSAPLCGEAVAAEILGLPHPFDPEMRAALSPNRLLVRDLVRGISV